MATCNICNEHLPEKDMADSILVMVDHLRLFHPEYYGEGPELWPDGGIVLEDHTLDPDDFTDEDDS